LKKAIVTEISPQAIGPYSQAVEFNCLIFCAGQIGIEAKSGNLVGGIKDQTRQVLENLNEILHAAGSSLENVLKVEVFLKNMADFQDMNQVYEKYFKNPYPARATVEVARLPKDALIEISCIAFKKLSRENYNKSRCCGEC